MDELNDDGCCCCRILFLLVCAAPGVRQARRGLSCVGRWRRLRLLLLAQCRQSGRPPGTSVDRMLDGIKVYSQIQRVPRLARLARQGAAKRHSELPSVRAVPVDVHCYPCFGPTGGQAPHEITIMCLRNAMLCLLAGGLHDISHPSPPKTSPKIGQDRSFHHGRVRDLTCRVNHYHLY